MEVQGDSFGSGFSNPEYFRAVFENCCFLLHFVLLGPRKIICFSSTRDVSMIPQILLEMSQRPGVGAYLARKTYFTCRDESLENAALDVERMTWFLNDLGALESLNSAIADV